MNNISTYNFNLESKIYKMLSQEDFNSGGCYLMYLKDSITNKPHPLNRLKGIDENGILYIGKGDNIGRRVLSLQKSIVPNRDLSCNDFKTGGHETLGQKFWRIREYLDKKELWVKVFVLNEIAANVIETYLIETYIKKYCETPPFNGNYGSYSFDECTRLLGNLESELKEVM